MSNIAVAPDIALSVARTTATYYLRAYLNHYQRCQRRDVERCPECESRGRDVRDAADSLERRVKTT